MKPSVHYVLCRWGRWAIKCQSGALGYATTSILLRMPEGDPEGYADPGPPPDVTNEDFESLTAMIEELPPVQELCVIQVYQLGAGLSYVKNAKVLGISKQALVEYIKNAQRNIQKKIEST
jgi:DNA-directed RNA polymerase specialized sigma24 family protein